SQRRLRLPVSYRIRTHRGRKVILAGGICHALRSTTPLAHATRHGDFLESLDHLAHCADRLLLVGSGPGWTGRFRTVHWSADWLDHHALRLRDGRARGLGAA